MEFHQVGDEVYLPGLLRARPHAYFLTQQGDGSFAVVWDQYPVAEQFVISEIVSGGYKNDAIVHNPNLGMQLGIINVGKFLPGVKFALEANKSFPLLDSMLIYIPALEKAETRGQVRSMFAGLEFTRDEKALLQYAKPEFGSLFYLAKVEDIKNPVDYYFYLQALHL